MSTDLVQSNTNGSEESNSAMYILGGAAIVLLGAGLALSSPSVRRYISQIKVGHQAEILMPDVTRYLRMRAM